MKAPSKQRDADETGSFAILPQSRVARIKALIFDKDGTLFNFNATWGAWTNGFILEITGGDEVLADRLATLFEYDRISATFAPTSPVIAESMEFVVDAVMNTVPGLEKNALRDHLIATTANAPQAPSVPLLPLFDRLSASGLTLAVATNDAVEPAKMHLKTAGILEYFSFVAGYDSGYGVKPDAGMLNAFRIVKKLDPEECLMIGDSAHDLCAGRAAGMTTMGVLTGPAPASDLVTLADIIVPDIGHIPRVLGI